MADDRMFDELATFLLKRGYAIKSFPRGCFDIVARKGSQILLLKALADANAITQEHAEEMAKVAAFVQGAPLVVAERAGGELEDGVIYSRLGVTTLNLPTLQAAIDGRQPFVRSTKAGLVADIDGGMLRENREAQGMSLAEASRKVGVSRQMIQRYEQEGVEITLQKAEKMHRAFGSGVFARADIFKATAPAIDGKPSPITKKYVTLGFEASRTRKVPFDVIAKRGKEVILTEVGDKVDPNIMPLSQLLDAERLVIFRRRRPKDLPAMTEQEFMEFEEAEELVKFLKEF
jgi:putative transcriptional regulator